MVLKTCLLIGLLLISQTHGGFWSHKHKNKHSDDPLCEHNEEPSDCYADCQPTCHIRDSKYSGDCKPGCVCKRGFIREYEDGKCIRKEKCPPVCGINEKYSKCYGHCEKTCENKSPVCNDICQSGCVCKDDYARDIDTNKCIEEDQCPPLCGKHEVYSECNGHCEKTCKNKNPKCKKICKPGCVCEPHYVRDVDTNECIKEHQCPQLCRKYEVYSECNGHCQKTCENKNPICKKICQSGCVCKPHYVRDIETYECIQEHQCPKLCGKNEVYSDCDGHCQKTCNNRNPVCKEICKPGCVCKPHYVRDIETDECIKEHQCPPLCGRYEEYSECYGHCQKTCENDNPKCPKICKPGCICQPGYVRDVKTNKCIDVDQCQVCQGPNEVFDCRGPCGEKKCVNLYKPCFVKEEGCIKKCYCKKGYARNIFGQCIPIYQCPIRTTRKVLQYKPKAYSVASAKAYATSQAGNYRALLPAYDVIHNHKYAHSWQPKAYAAASANAYAASRSGNYGAFSPAYDVFHKHKYGNYDGFLHAVKPKAYSTASANAYASSHSSNYGALPHAYDKYHKHKYDDEHDEYR